ncbi:SidA/IucD/PvdA family monooxygenase [Variovorax arabinosiphilus]|uniref:SidA/IucD/PvdA family monooxygenase n=1 Tax=Variovorax arabinosiphilus TaxID=3053498 RepID=UPI00257827DB|nr:MULTISPECIES: SidA/IucD/PvdA family monooxygenase [unclassified Variovorax]MDM0119059.1 SidA/IucD/PvdA family monooxygenase [Variovorax sp. J2L1-78]MDM0129485.1 SidA/IucD/PvdA family monooxygenase [Variovorax sp. J2L1-63]MDM0232729.1 SidA/IucD/PvdA family monooxygenase [Variovorax sp. J2R1-6]
MTSPSPSTPDHFAHEALRLLGPAPANWVPAHEGVDHNVLVVGAGQTGSAFAFALQRAGIGGVAVIDAAGGASQAGVWRTRARMHKLRTLKHLVGPEGPVSALGFQAWYESRHGQAAYAAIDRIARTDWAEYLDWFRGITGTAVRYGTRLVRFAPVTGGAVPHFRLHLDVDGVERVETARKLIFANGVAGSGAPFVPEPLSAALSQGLAAHTGHAIDFTALAGKTVAVVGGAASAFDAAAVALESGAAAVHLFVRRDKIPATPVARVRGYPGFYDNYLSLPDATRWHHAARYRRLGTTPPPDSVQRVLRFPNFHLHLGAPWQGAQVQAGQVVASVHDQRFHFDFVIAGTGYTHELSQRPELAGIADLVLRWRDRFQPPADERDDELGAAPYLGAGLEYIEKIPGTAPWLRDIHTYNPGGFASTGLPLGDVPSIRGYVPAVVRRISEDLLLADLALHEARTRADVPADFGEELYAGAVWRPGTQRLAA